jgi:lipopolysaccharide transport system permease protein
VGDPGDDASLIEREVAAASQLRHPRQFFGDALRSLRASTTLARRLFVRDLRARYRQSVLGLLWIALPVVAQTAVWLFLNAVDVINTGETRLPYPVYVLVGTLLWQSFAEGLSSPVNQLTAAAQLLSKVSFPAESVLLAGTADVAVNALVRLLIAVPVLVVYGVAPGAGLLLAPLGMVTLVGLGIAIGLVVAPFALLYHDLSRLLLLVTGFWLLITPVAYVLPDDGLGRLLSVLNPVTPLIVATREWLTGGAVVPPTAFWFVLVGTAGLLVAGWVLLRLSIPHLVDRFGS